MSSQPADIMPPGRQPTAIERAIQATKATIERRSRLHRNLVVVVVLVGLLVSIAALAMRNTLPLCGLILLIPLCGLFWTRDLCLVGRWRTAVFELWQSEGLRLTTLVAALASLPPLPPRTLAGMLTALCGGQEPSALERLSAAEKADLAQRLQSRGRRDLVHLWCGTAAATCVMACVAAVVFRPTPAVFVCLSIALLAWLFCRLRFR
jgi:Flp pilus assembly protein TadB